MKKIYLFILTVLLIHSCDQNREFPKGKLYDRDISFSYGIYCLDSDRKLEYDYIFKTISNEYKMLLLSDSFPVNMDKMALF